MQVADILGDRDYGIHMRLSKGELGAFYRPGPGHAEILAERKQWLADDPHRYLAIEPEGVALLDEAIGMAISLDTLASDANLSRFSDADPVERCRALGEQWEADFLLLQADGHGVFRLRGGCLCFPSHWALRDKLNLPMAAIHQPVPTLNETLGHPIDTFLQRIKPGISWERQNWGLSRSPERNLHPARLTPRLDDSIGIHDVWWRLEEQSLAALPQSGGILFGIKIVLVTLAEIKADPNACRGMVRALQTMPDAMAIYKGIAPARNRLLQLLGAQPG